jgi:hypothetical protein
MIQGFNLSNYFMGIEVDEDRLRGYIEAEKTLLPLIERFEYIFCNYQDPKVQFQKVQWLARLKLAIDLSAPSEKSITKKKRIAFFKPKLTPLEQSRVKAIEVFKERNYDEKKLINLVEWACAEGNLGRLKDLDRIGAVFTFHTAQIKMTPLHYALQYGQEDVADWLMKEKKVDVSALAASNIHAIHLACQHTFFKTVRELLKQKVNPNQMTDFSSYPLHYVCWCWKKDYVRSEEEVKRDARLALYLFTWGANPGLKDSTGRIPAAYLGEKWRDVIKTAFTASKVTESNPFKVPLDIWKYIFRKLSEDDFFNVVSVCKTWNRAAILDLTDQFILASEVGSK